MTFSTATLVFDVFNIGGHRRSGSNFALAVQLRGLLTKIKRGVIRYGTARATDALRNGHIY